ncbi:hypothetical protein BKA81DRAFT_372588 [Phyllosticta paracitricarpa]
MTSRKPRPHSSRKGLAKAGRGFTLKTTMIKWRRAQFRQPKTSPANARRVARSRMMRKRRISRWFLPQSPKRSRASARNPAKLTKKRSQSPLLRPPRTSLASAREVTTLKSTVTPLPQTLTRSLARSTRRAAPSVMKSVANRSSKATDRALHTQAVYVGQSSMKEGKKDNGMEGSRLDDRGRMGDWRHR